MPEVNREYSDLNLSLIPHPISGDVLRVRNADAVKRAIRHLILGNNYEFPFQPHKGSGITYLLFEPISQITSQSIKMRISEVITLYEPRADLHEVRVVVTADENAYRATIIFSVINLIEPVTMDILLERTR